LIDNHRGNWRPFSRLFDHFLQGLPSEPLLSSDAQARIWQGIVPAMKTVFEVAAKQYL
jgi:hypothetical protein